MSEKTFLSQLEEEFNVKPTGSEPVVHHDFFKNHKWTLRQMAFSDFEISTSLMHAEGIYLHPDQRVRVSFAAIATAAIDDKPLWEVFGVMKPEEATEALAGCHPLNPPVDVKFKAAMAFYRFLMNSKKFSLVNHLFEVYSKHLDEEDEDKSKKKDETPEQKEPVTGDPGDRPTKGL
jgi:hypothetical protein